jgi:hypothetical protein
MPARKPGEPASLQAALARIRQLEAALERHQQWCTDAAGKRLCGGCLDRWPCPDRRRLGIGRVTARRGGTS